MKKLFFLVLIIVAAAAGGAYWFVKSGEYKPYLEQQIETATGRKVKVAGEVNFSFYPWLGLVANEVSVSNTKEFSHSEFARIKRIKLKTELLPLLRYQVKADKILLEGLDLNLITDKAGRSNWASEAKTDGNLNLDFLKEFSFSEFRISDANIRYQDQAKGTVTEVDKLDLTLGAYRTGQALPVATNFTLLDGKSKNTVNAEFNLNFDLAESIFTLNNLTAGLQPAGLKVESSSPVLINAKKETVSAESLKLSGSGFNADASLNINQIFSYLVADGSLNNIKANLRQVFAANKVKLDTADKNALKSLTGKLNFSLAGDKLNLTEIIARLDKTNLSGSANLNVKNEALNFNLLADSINLDNYLSAGASGNDSPLLPINYLRELNLGGKLKFTKNVIYTGLNLSKPSFGINAKDKVLKIKPINAGVFGGLYFGGGTINLKGKTPALSFNENLKSINAKQLLEFLIGKDYIGGNVWLEGRANASARVNLHGNTVNSFIKTLSGKLNLNLNKGLIKGINLMEELTRAQMLAEKKAPTKSTAKKETRINKFVANSNAKNGVIYTNNLLVTTNIFKVTGKGTAGLVSEQLNYNLLLEVLNTKGIEKTAVKDLVGYKIPFTLKGSFANPKINIDIEALLKARAKQELDKKKAELKKRLAEEKAKQKKRLEEEKAKAKKKAEEKLKEKLKDKLDSDKLKDKLRDKLKDLF